MLTFTERLSEHGYTPTHVVSLPFELRQRSRLRCSDAAGEELALMLSRGGVLRNGDLLRSESGQILRIEAAAETVSVVHSTDAFALCRAAYHLGNRHIPLEIAAGRLAYLHDHVLDDMVRTLGFPVATELARFEPEPGAYGGHSHRHGDHDADAHADHHHEAHGDLHHHEDPSER